jgi:hypothetical protein
MSLSSIMERRSTTITYIGTMLFAWFVFESVQFIYSGQLADLVRTLPQFFHNRFLVGIYVVLHLIMASIGAFAAAPLILRGYRTGLILGVAYCLSGNTINPLSYLFPDSALITQANDPTSLSQVIDILWLFVSLAILLSFFILQRHRRNHS